MQRLTSGLTGRGAAIGKDVVHRIIGARRAVGWLLVGLPLGFFTYDVLWFLGHYVSGYFSPSGVNRTLLLLTLEAAISALPVGIGVALLVRPGWAPRPVHTEHPLRRAAGWTLVLLPSAYTILQTGTEGLVLGGLIVCGVLLLRASRPQQHPSVSVDSATADDPVDEPVQDEFRVTH